jgi:hypothetical protein
LETKADFNKEPRVMSALPTVRPIGMRDLRFNRKRAAGVLGAALSAAAVWAVAVPLLGIQLVVRFGSGPIQVVGIEAVVISAMAGSLAGWFVLAMLERLFRKGLTIWTGLATAGVLASLSVPLIAGTTLSTKIALPLMHLAVGAVLIPAMRRGSIGGTV